MSNTKQTRLTDKDRIEILKDYEDCQNIRQVARKYKDKWSYYAIRNIIKGDSEVNQKISQKKQECIETTLEHMEQQHELKKSVLDKLLKGIELKANDLKKIDKMNIKDLATAYGIILDKELKVLELKRNNGNVENEINNNIMNIADLINNPSPNRSEDDVQ